MTNIEDEIVDIPALPRKAGWKSTEQRVKEHNDRAREKHKTRYIEYSKKNKLKIKKQKHDYYIRSMKLSKRYRIERYANDPEWREQVKAYNRERMRKIRAEKLRMAQQNDEEEQP